MLCEICKKNPATIHFSEISGKVVGKELHICEECAKKSGLQKLGITLMDVISKITSPLPYDIHQKLALLKCPKCQMTFADFRAKSRFGCANDFEIFKKGLIPIFEKIHGSSQHRGKIPASEGAELREESELAILNRELEQMVKIENYEKAAEIRDKIKLIKAKFKGELKSEN